jgi:hypothetical protein
MTKHAAWLSVLVLFGVTSASADSADATRYPYDPACGWGRVADGRGMIVRCITQAEAQALVGRPAASATPSAQPSASAAPPPPATPAAMTVEASIGPVSVTDGSLPEAEKKLKKALKRFAECVNQHGGMSATEGEVQVKFLVRERGRAEGVEVVKRQGMTQAAARCVADVVDRRDVGLPDAPIVTATVAIKFRQQAK